MRKSFPARLRNQLIFAGLEPVLSHTEKLCLASYCGKIIHDNAFVMLFVYVIVASSVRCACDDEWMESQSAVHTFIGLHV